MNADGNGENSMDTTVPELLHRYLSGETTGEENERVEELLENESGVTALLEDLSRVRDKVRRAVSNTTVPEDLALSIRKSTVGNAGAKVIPLDVAPRSIRFRGLYAAAAALAILVAGWFLIERYSGGAAPPDSHLAEALGPAEEMLRIGLTDHLKCALTFYKGDVHPYSMERMKEGLGEEFAGLIPIVRDKITQGTLVVAHKCSFGGRNYVHLVVKDNEKMMSVAITRKRDGESLTSRDGKSIEVSGTPVYYAELEGFDVAGFDAGEFMVFVASDLDVEANLAVASDILSPVSTYLKQVKA